MLFFPRKIIKKAFVFIVIFWIISLTLVFILGFDCARKILSFFSSFIGLPASILGLLSILSIIDENKLINKTLIEAGKNDQKEWEKIKKQMEQSVN
jgi:hypothetical protein